MKRSILLLFVCVPFFQAYGSQHVESLETVNHHRTGDDEEKEGARSSEEAIVEEKELPASFWAFISKEDPSKTESVKTFEAVIERPLHEEEDFQRILKNKSEDDKNEDLFNQAAQEVFFDAAMQELLGLS